MLQRLLHRVGQQGLDLHRLAHPGELGRQVRGQAQQRFPNRGAAFPDDPGGILHQHHPVAGQVIIHGQGVGLLLGEPGPLPDDVEAIAGRGRLAPRGHPCRWRK